MIVNMKAVIVTFFLLGLALANPQSEIQSSKDSVDIFKGLERTLDSLSPNARLEMITTYVEMVIFELKTIIVSSGLDPMKLLDGVKRISHKIGIIEYWGELKLSNGYLRGAASIIRNGKVSMNYANRTLSVDVPVAFDEFNIDYKYNVRIMGIGPKGGVKGKAANIRMFLKFNVDFNDMKVSLENFDSRIGRISVQFTGHGLFDWLINIMSNVTTTFFKFIIVNLCEGIFKAQIEKYIVDLNDLLKSWDPYP